MLECYRVNVTLDLEVIEAIAYYAPSEDHIQDLLHSATSLILELIIN